MIKRTLKFTLCAALIAAGASVYADGASEPGENTGASTEADNGPAVVTLNDADKTQISWSAFVDKINNPIQVTDAPVPTDDPAAVALKNAQDRLETANENLKTKQDLKETAQTEYNTADVNLNGDETTGKPSAATLVANAKAEQTAAGTRLSTAQTNYLTASKEYNAAIGQQLDATNAVTAAKNELDKKYKNQIDEKTAKYNDVKDNQIPAQIKLRDDNEADMKSLMVASTTPESWLTDAETAAQAFSNAYDEYMAWASEMEEQEKNPATETYTGTNANIYVKKATNTTTTKKFYISFDESYKDASGWTPYDVAGYENTFINGLLAIPAPKASTKWQIYYSFGSVSDDKEALIEGLSMYTYGSLNELIISTLKGLEDEEGYCTEGELTAPTSPQSDVTAYNRYKAAYEAAKVQVEKLTEDNNNLLKEIQDLQNEETSSDEYKTWQSATNTLNSINAVIAKYRATKQPGENGEPCTDADGNPISYIDWLSDQVTVAQADKADADEAVSTAQENLTTYTNAFNTANSRLESAIAAVETAQQGVDSAQAAVDNAQIAYAAAQKTANETATTEANLKYQEVTLTGDVDVTEPITKAYTGTIYGGNNIINVPSGVAFNSFTGKLYNVAINGTFATAYAGATFGNVAVNTGSAYRFYDDHGQPSTPAITTLAQLGYKAREICGINLTTKKLVPLTDNTKVFNISIYSPTASPLQSYVVCDGTTLTGTNGTVTIPANMFAKSEDADINVFPELANVYYEEEGNFICENVVIKDKVNFYCPENLKATKVSMDREFKAGMTTVCLPFVTNKEMNGNITGICTYDQEDPNHKKFWFTKVAGDVDANTPILLFASAPFTLNFTDVEIAKTTSQIMKDAAEDGSASYGTFKKVESGEFDGQFNSDKVYGLSNGKFTLAGTNATFPAFRMVITSATAEADVTTAAPRSIGILDSRGLDITEELMGSVSGVENATEATSLTVVGGQGAIEFIADADYGKVEVYNVNGGLVTVADVTEGTTRVSVEKGIYIVMGKKVMVK